MCDLRCAPAGDWGWFDKAWPLLERAHRGPESLADICEMFAAGTAQVWVALDGDMVRAAMLTTSHRDTLHLWLCGGDNCDWRALGDAVADAARGRFRRLTINGRRGWGRALSGFVRRADGILERAT